MVDRYAWSGGSKPKNMAENFDLLVDLVEVNPPRGVYVFMVAVIAPYPIGTQPPYLNIVF